MIKLILDYEKIADSTDRFAQDDIQSILLGLFGEVGSIMAALKKLKRDGTDFSIYKEAVVEELGDAFWYFTALTKRYELSILDMVPDSVKNNINTQRFDSRGLETAENIANTSKALIKLGQKTSSIIGIKNADKSEHHQILSTFAIAFFELISHAEVDFKDVLKTNSDKIKDCFIMPDDADLLDFDKDFSPEEQLPRKFEIEIKERKNGKVYMQMNGVFIGDPLTDNIRVEDFFRFHDVLHFSHVAILHWSPTIRGLLKRKRKSKPAFDEGEDSGRGVVIEEGLAAWVFSKAKELDYFDGHDKISIDILKTIKDFVKGYEVAQCPAALWEKAILDGYKVFRQVVKSKSGIIIVNRDERTLTYRPIDKKND
ncbi:MAG: nucleoside triphosphate pyrophosphohydrolase family protein [Proteobacteria bacterium]|nr:nucleoside triphosphate pyrophosphohydrolase family protein [Pseudomonadota bacterium]